MTQPLSGETLVPGIDKAISRLALGTAFYRHNREGDWHAILDAFVEHGGTALDTAFVYGDSESVVGDWLDARGCRETMVLCTKGGVGDHVLPDADLEAIIGAELRQSLERLKTTCVDLYYLHRDNPAVPVARIVECLNEHVARGRVRALGASNWRYERVDAANAYAATHGLVGFAAVSNHLSLAMQAEPFYPGLVAVEQEGIDWHRRTGIPLLPWSSQARGFFTGRFRPGQVDPADGFARRMLEVYATEANLERLRRADALAAGKGCSAVEIALAWVLGQGIPVVPLVGPHTVDELRSCIRATSLALSQDEMHWLNLEE